jgi:DNA topoisomerase-1
MPVHRVVFHEITEEAIKKAFRHPREIDINLVNAQQARRILDRLVGYKISPLLWRKVKGGLSAGRVQSVALRMIAEREREIQNFVPKEYWTIEAELAKRETRVPSFRAKFIGSRCKAQRMEIHNQQQAEEVATTLETAAYIVAKVSKKNVSRSPSPPFTTSTLQQEAWRKLHFTAQHTMTIAQQLYEGLPLGEEGIVGLITYMRTDSTKVADLAIKETCTYIEQRFGREFLPPHHRQFAKKVKGAQEAHEAIRPTKIGREPGLILPYLSHDQAKLYQLIWKRMVASQMAAALFDTTTVDIEATSQQRGIYLLRATGSVPKFLGFLTLYSEGKDEAESDEEGRKTLPDLAAGEGLLLLHLFPEQHFTQPPPRYNEATLVKSLEERGIGRPSTYAPIISTIQRRGYVQRKEGRFYPQEVGLVVSGLLAEHFPDIVNLDFTAQMEDRLDEIARGEREWIAVVQDFYTPFKKTLNKAIAEMTKVKIADQPTTEICPECGKAMVIRSGRYGKFLACSGFPRCKSTKPLLVNGREG